MQKEYLVVHDLLVNTTEIVVGATNSQRWLADTVEYGMSGVDATTIVYVCLNIHDNGYIEESAGFYCRREDPLRTLAMQHIHDLFEIAWRIQEQQLNQQLTRKIFFGQRIPTNQ